MLLDKKMLEKALNPILKALFRDTPIAHLCTWHLEVQMPGAGLPKPNFQNAVQDCLFQVASAL